jgi:hypothetical protein
MFNTVATKNIDPLLQSLIVLFVCSITALYQSDVFYLDFTINYFGIN